MTPGLYSLKSAHPLESFSPTAIDPGVPAAIFGLNFSYDLPFGKQKRFLTSASKLVDSVLGGWTVSGFMRYESGAALQIKVPDRYRSMWGSVSKLIAFGERRLALSKGSCVSLVSHRATDSRVRSKLRACFP